MKTGYSARQAAKLLKLNEKQVRDYGRAASLGQGSPKSYGFSDLVVLRMAKRLHDTGMEHRRVLRALSDLRDGDPAPGTTLDGASGVVLARDDRGVFEPDSGQCCIDFSSRADRRPGGKKIDLALPERSHAPTALTSIADARQWFELAVDLEASSPERAYEAYLRALACDPEHVEAMINVGRLCSAAGDRSRAAAYFRQAIRVDPTQPVAHFNLGVTLHDLGDIHGAVVAYRTVLIHDPHFADAHYNLSTLFESQGDRQGAIKHMAAYRVTSKQSD